MSYTPRQFSGYTKTEPDPLIAVIDHQLEIERKARAWDALYEHYRRRPSLTDRADEMDDILLKA